jgi:hypothetical protein
MYIEDLLIRIRDALISYRPWRRLFDSLSEWQRSFIQSVGRHVDQGKSLSTKQSKIVLQLIEQVKPYLIEYGWATETDITKLLHDPQFRRPLYESTNVPKEVRHLGNNLLAFRFKKNELLRDRLKAVCHPKQKVPDETLNDGLIRPRFDWLYKIWIIPVYRFNILPIIQIINDEHFGVDQEAIHYLRLAKSSFNRPSMFAIGEEVIFANVCDDPILAGWITEVAHGIAL